MQPAAFRKSRHGACPVKVSFEFFPPKTPEMEQTLWHSIERLAPLNPHFVSVTYGAGGSTRERTHNTVARLVRETKLLPAAHLTCVAATSWRCAAIRSAASARLTSPIPAATSRPAI
jgi:methylenetetrahydrofolate reductase (NADPH)